MGKKPKKPFVAPDLVHGALHSLLCTINALEGSEVTQDTDLVAKARDLLYDFKNHLGTLADFQYNDCPKLVALDAVFTAAGWDDQGIRWQAQPESDGEDIFIVEFTDKNHEEWKVS